MSSTMAVKDDLASGPLFRRLAGGIRFSDGRELPEDALMIIKKFVWIAHPAAFIIKKLQFHRALNNSLRVYGDELFPWRRIRLSRKSAEECWWRDREGSFVNTMRFRHDVAGEPKDLSKNVKATLQDIWESRIQFRIQYEERIRRRPAEWRNHRDILEDIHPNTAMPVICWHCEWYPCECRF